MATDAPSTLNAICPYYTMFPLSFPLRVIREQKPDGWVVDPFCGRGTTNLAARICGRATVGLDSSPIAVAIAKAKLCQTTAGRVVNAARQILSTRAEVDHRPSGEFWRWMYHPRTLTQVCRLREALLDDCSSEARIVLRAIVLGALHGPLAKTRPSYLSNQCPRTYAPKPAYSVRFWKRHRMKPPCVDVASIIQVRAERFLHDRIGRVDGNVRLGDSRVDASLPDVPIGLVITSPPYYGMRTYIPDQWLRSWFLGGAEAVVYRPPAREINHSSPHAFAGDLRNVWLGLAARAKSSARLVVRFGGISDRRVDHVQLLKLSLQDSGWTLQTIVDAGNADFGRRQAIQFKHGGPAPKTEYDFYACRA